MGGHQVTQGPNDDGYDEDGYDESQRAEILEVTRGGPSDGAVQIGLDPDIGQDIDADDDDIETEDGTATSRETAEDISDEAGDDAA